jgi:hypothetical protein
MQLPPKMQSYKKNCLALLSINLSLSFSQVVALDFDRKETFFL